MMNRCTRRPQGHSFKQWKTLADKSKPTEALSSVQKMRLLYLAAIAVFTATAYGKTYSATMNRFRIAQPKEQTSTNPLQLNDAFSAKVEGNYIEGFQTVLSIGTPPKPFTLTLDTHAVSSWVPGPCRTPESHPDAHCEHSDPQLCDPVFCDHPHERYIPQESKSGSPKNGLGDLEVSYRKVSTKWYSDVVSLGNLSDPQFAHSPNCQPPSPAVIATIEMMTFGRTGEGFLGLGIPVKPIWPPDALTVQQQRQTSIFESLLKTNRKTFDHPWFTMSYNDCSKETRFLLDRCKNAGDITFGGVDEKICNRQIQWLQRAPTPEVWSGLFSGLMINGEFYKESFDMEISTRYSSLMFISKKALDFLVKKVGAYHTRDGSYEYLCDRHFSLGLRPTTGQDVPLVEDVLRREAYKPTATRKICILNIAESSGKWHIPLQFLRELCVVHDWDNKRVGFARRVGSTAPVTIPPQPVTIPPQQRAQKPTASRRSRRRRNRQGRARMT